MRRLKELDAPQSLQDLYNHRTIRTVWTECEQAYDMCWLIHHSDYTTSQDMTNALTACLKELKWLKTDEIPPHTSKYNPNIYAQEYYSDAVISVEDNNWSNAIAELVTALEYKGLSQIKLCDAIRQAVPFKHPLFDNTKYVNVRKAQLERQRMGYRRPR